MTVLVDEDSRNVSVVEGQAVCVCTRTLGRADFIIRASFQPLVVSGSALPNEDFVTDLQQLQFPANSDALQCVDIQTTGNDVVEGREEFQVQLGVESDNTGVTLGAAALASVSIIDNNCKSIQMVGPRVVWRDGHVI